MMFKPVKSPLFWAAIAVMLLAQTAMSQTSGQTAVGDAAAEYGLGNPRPETPKPIQTPKPRDEGWWQAFERGWVYWHPRHGARW